MTRNLSFGWVREFSWHIETCCEWDEAHVTISSAENNCWIIVDQINELRTFFSSTVWLTLLLTLDWTWSSSRWLWRVEKLILSIDPRRCGIWDGKFDESFFFGVLVNIRIGLDDPTLTIGEWISKNKHTCELNYAINIGWAEIALLNPSSVWGARAARSETRCVSNSVEFGRLVYAQFWTLHSNLCLFIGPSLPSKLDSMGNELLGWSRARKKHTAAPCHTRV